MNSNLLNLSELVHQHFSDNIQTQIQSADTLAPQIIKAGQLLAESLIQGHKILICGNGESAADSERLAASLLNKFEIERPSLPVISLSGGMGVITSIANDDHYSQIFSKQIEALAQAGDVLVLLSTGGNSPNILKAAEAAHHRNAKIIALTGKDGGKLAKLLTNHDIEIRVPSDRSARIQECHLLTIHCLCDLIDQQLFKN
jgi:DnaA initiator-associating protein